jgi:hypothetical protein
MMVMFKTFNKMEVILCTSMLERKHAQLILLSKTQCRLMILKLSGALISLLSTPTRTSLINANNMQMSPIAMQTLIVSIRRQTKYALKNRSGCKLRTYQQTQHIGSHQLTSWRELITPDWKEIIQLSGVFHLTKLITTSTWLQQANSSIGSLLLKIAL